MTAYIYTPGDARPPERFTQVGKHAYAGDDELRRRIAIWEAGDAAESAPATAATEHQSNVGQDPQVEDPLDHLQNEKSSLVGAVQGEQQRDDTQAISDSEATNKRVALESEVALRQFGLGLLQTGYDIVPVARGSKAPMIKGWQHFYGKHRATQSSIEGWVARNSAGVGILARSAPGVDIDVRHKDVAEAMRDNVCKRIGAIRWRVGSAPKLLIPCKTDAPFPKITSATFVSSDGFEHKVEILGDGQQWVCSGVHPGTNEPYRWFGTDMFTSECIDIPRDALPILSLKIGREIVADFEAIAERKGWKRSANIKQLRPVDRHTDESDVLSQAEREARLAGVGGTEIAELRSALASMESDERGLWVKMAHALFCLEEVGKNLWLEWSRKSDKFDEGEAERVWNSCSASRSDFRTVFTEAARHGWKNPRISVIAGTPQAGAITAEAILSALRKKSKDQILVTWAALAAPLAREVADEVLEEVHRLTSIKVRTLNATLRDARKALSDEQKQAAAQRRVGKRQIIHYQPDDRTRQAHEVEALIVKAAKPGEYIVFAGLLAQMIQKELPYTHGVDGEDTAPPPTPQIEPLDDVAVLAKVEAQVAFEVMAASGPKLIAVPSSIVDILIKKKDHSAPKVSGLVTHPIVLPNGYILAEDGLHRDSKLFLSGASGLGARAYTEEEARRAIENIRTELFGGFEFASQLDADVALAALLTGVQRRVLDISPGLAVLAAMQASGKTTLLRKIHIVLTGRDMPVSTFPENDEAEVGKRLLAMLMRSPAMVCFDNVTDGTTFRSSAIAAVMTGPILVQRVLGVSREAECLTNVFLGITGNNLALGPDELTRWMVCRLAPSSARPHERTFEHADVLNHTLQLRNQILRDVVGIVAGYIKSGANMSGPHGSRFPKWDRMVRQSLLWAGVSDVAEVFLANVEASEDLGACLGLLSALRMIFRDNPFYASDVAGAVGGGLDFGIVNATAARVAQDDENERNDLKIRLRTALETLRAKDPTSGRSVGRVLNGIVGRPATSDDGDLRLERLPKKDGTPRYRVSIRECV